MLNYMKYSFKNKTILITGSSIGIGRETALKFAAEGGNVVITYYNDRGEALAVADKCRELGANEVMITQLNVIDNDSIKDAVDKVAARFGEISVLINNAGVVVWKHLFEQSFENIEQQVRINIEGLIKMTKMCLPYLKDTVINMASGAGMVGFPELTTYCATKFAVRGFTESLAKEMPSLNVFSINPGMTATRMNNFKGQSPEKVADIILNVAKGEYGVKSGQDVNVWEVPSRVEG